MTQRTIIPFPDGSWYQWHDESVDTLSVQIQVPLTIEKEDVHLELLEHGISCTIKGDQPAIRGQLYAFIKSESLTMTLESMDDFKLLSLKFKKADGSIQWPLLIKSGLTSSLPSDLDPHSLYLLANGVTAQDPMTALKLYSYAADHDNIPALLKLAAWYEIGKEEAPQMIPVERNPQVSLYYHVKAAELGSNEACYIVMSACIHGTNGSEKSYVQAIHWAEKALADPKLKQNSPKLFIAIHWQAGLIFMEGEHGLGAPQPQKAVEHWEQSGSLNHPHSLWNLGIFHLNGFGVIQDIEKGISLIKQGMALDSSLKMAPQLKDLSEEELNMAIEIAKQSPANTSLIDVESLVKMAQLMTAAPKTVSTPAKSEDQPQEPLQMQEMDKVAREPSNASPKPKRRTKQAHPPNQFYLEEYLWIAIPAAVIGLFVVARSRQWI